MSDGALAGDAIDAAWGDVTRLLRAARDIVAEREGLCLPPPWATRRGWVDFVLGLSAAEVVAAGQEGLGRLPGVMARAPTDLRALAEAAVEVEARVAWTGGPPAADGVETLGASLPQPAQPGAEVAVDLHLVDTLGASPRKQAQVAAFTGAVEPLARGAARILDVGSGHGHLTRHLARLGGRPVLGLERDPARVRASVRFARRAGDPAEFAARDVVGDGLDLRPGDLAVGLHACGALGDAVSRAVADSGASLALLSCCLQKVPTTERAALSTPDPELRWPRVVLGLSNLSAGDAGVEADLETRWRARRQRVALNRLLALRGVELPLGDEMRGINRKRTRGDLASLSAPAFARYLPGAPPPSPAELREAEQAAARADEALSRFGAVRGLFARSLEVFGVLDRARLLQATHEVRVEPLFDRGVSPRNLLLTATPR